MFQQFSPARALKKSPADQFLDSTRSRTGASSKNNKTTVTVVGLRGIPDISGGIETHCEYLYPKVAEIDRRDNITIFGRRPSMGFATISLSSNLECVPLSAPRNKYMETIANTFIGVIAARFRNNSSILHLHAVGPSLMAPFARLLGMKVVMTHHGDDYKRKKWNRFAKSVLKAGEMLGVGFANKIIAVSPSLAERLKSEYPSKADAIHYIPNGADHILTEQQYSKKSSAEWVADFGLTDQPYLVSVGRLVPEKGFADLIEAYAQARPPAKLVIVGGKSGSSHDEEIVQLIADKDLQEDVVLTGAIPRAGVAGLLEHAKLFVLASHHEGLPIAALEASAMGTPILVSDIQPNLDLGLDRCHYFPVNAPKALAAKLDKHWNAMPQPDLLSTFNWESIAVQTSRVYRELALVENRTSWNFQSLNNSE